jgi:hypothetical protein
LEDAASDASRFSSTATASPRAAASGFSGFATTTASVFSVHTPKNSGRSRRIVVFLSSTTSDTYACDSKTARISAASFSSSDCSTRRRTSSSWALSTSINSSEFRI